MCRHTATWAAYAPTLQVYASWITLCVLLLHAPQRRYNGTLMIFLSKWWHRTSRLVVKYTACETSWEHERDLCYFNKLLFSIHCTGDIVMSCQEDGRLLGHDSLLVLQRLANDLGQAEQRSMSLAIVVMQRRFLQTCHVTRAFRVIVATLCVQFVPPMCHVCSLCHWLNISASCMSYSSIFPLYITSSHFPSFAFGFQRNKYIKWCAWKLKNEFVAIQMCCVLVCACHTCIEIRKLHHHVFVIIHSIFEIVKSWNQISKYAHTAKHAQQLRCKQAEVHELAWQCTSVMHARGSCVCCYSATSLSSKANMPYAVMCVHDMMCAKEEHAECVYFFQGCLTHGDTYDGAQVERKTDRHLKDLLRCVHRFLMAASWGRRDERSYCSTCWIPTGTRMRVCQLRTDEHAWKPLLGCCGWSWTPAQV